VSDGVESINRTITRHKWLLKLLNPRIAYRRSSVGSVDGSLRSTRTHEAGDGSTPSVGVPARGKTTMTDDRFHLSRRKALAALGTVGVASAGAGLGTSAYFSDQETFENNQLTAGTLDLGVGYSAHYSDWSDDEGDGVGDVVMYDGSAGETGGVSDLQPGYVGLPSNEAWLISVPDGDVETFLANTETGAVDNGDCDDLTQADSITNPVIDLDDVKPGDFGEVTFDLELCTNPGYVWINNPGGVTAAENGLTEPEADDPQEDGDADSTDPADVELLDVVQAAVWLDDGDNYQDGGESPLLAGSLRTVLSALGSENGVRIDGVHKPIANATPTDFTRTGVTRFDTGGDGNYDADVELVDDPDGSGKVAHATSGGTATDDYVTTGVSLDPAPTLGELTDDPTTPTTTLTYDYYGGADNGSSAPDEVYLLVEESDGTRHVVYRASNDGAPADETWKTRNVHREVAGNPANNAGFNWFELNDDGSTTNLGGGGPTSDLSTEFGDDAVVLAMAAGRGTLGGGDVLDTYYRDPAVGGTSVGPFPTACFRGETDFSAVFAWWVPVDHGNEMQSDRATFDLGFYTEQCRHNDGSGMDDAPVDDDPGESATVTVQGFPSNADLGDTINTVNVDFPGVNAVDSFGSTNWSVGPSGTENVQIDGSTVELDYPDNSNDYTSDTFLELTVTVSGATGSYDADFVFEDDDDSAVDATDSFTI
jgi:predicted ribosomally synthesized peptide with SipW-like signal peptide